VVTSSLPGRRGSDGSTSGLNPCSSPHAFGVTPRLLRFRVAAFFKPGQDFLLSINRRRVQYCILVSHEALILHHKSCSKQERTATPSPRAAALLAEKRKYPSGQSAADSPKELCQSFPSLTLPKRLMRSDSVLDRDFMRRETNTDIIYGEEPKCTLLPPESGISATPANNERPSRSYFRIYHEVQPL